MARYIDVNRDSFPALHQKELNDYMKGWNTCLKSVLQQPTADVVEEKHGKWEHSKRGLNLEGDYECSACHSPDGIKHFYGLKKYSYCPNCGAKMDGQRK